MKRRRALRALVGAALGTVPIACGQGDDREQHETDAWAPTETVEGSGGESAGDGTGAAPSGSSDAGPDAEDGPATPPDLGPPGPLPPDVEPVREPFTIVMVPDTQYTVQNWPGDYFAQMEWIVANREALNIRFVIHVGDLQEVAYRVVDWENAASGLDILQGVVPYAVAIGNHDFDAWADPGDHHANIAADRSTSKFNQYVPRSRMTAYHTFGGTLPTGGNDNSWHVLAAGGTDWLILTLKYRPIAEELAWAREVIEAHPDHRIIVNTHEYLKASGGPSAAGLTIWNDALRMYPNVSMVVSGHLTGVNREVAVGDGGNEVVQMLTDFQSTTHREANSYLRIMQFDPVAGTVSVSTYSPAFDSWLTGDETIECPPWECPVSGGHEFVLESVPFPLAKADWLSSRATEDCLGIEDGSVADGARATSTACDGQADQQWQARDAGEGYSHVTVRSANKCLNVVGSSLDDGAEVIVWRCGPEHNSMWRIEDVDGGWVRLVARHSEKCLQLADTGDGLVQSTCTDDPRQHFLRSPI